MFKLYSITATFVCLFIFNHMIMLYMAAERSNAVPTSAKDYYIDNKDFLGLKQTYRIKYLKCHQDRVTGLLLLLQNSEANNMEKVIKTSVKSYSLLSPNTLRTLLEDPVQQRHQEDSSLIKNLFRSPVIKLNGKIVLSSEKGSGSGYSSECLVKRISNSPRSSGLTSSTTSADKEEVFDDSADQAYGFIIYFDKCGTISLREGTNLGVFNHFYIQMNPLVMTDQDLSIPFTCDYNLKNGDRGSVFNASKSEKTLESYEWIETESLASRNKRSNKYHHNRNHNNALTNYVIGELIKVKIRTTDQMVKRIHIIRCQCHNKRGKKTILLENNSPSSEGKEIVVNQIENSASFRNDGIFSNTSSFVSEYLVEREIKANLSQNSHVGFKELNFVFTAFQLEEDPETTIECTVSLHYNKNNDFSTVNNKTRIIRTKMNVKSPWAVAMENERKSYLRTEALKMFNKSIIDGNRIFPDFCLNRDGFAFVLMGANGGIAAFWIFCYFLTIKCFVKPVKF